MSERNIDTFEEGETFYSVYGDPLTTGLLYSSNGSGGNGIQNWVNQYGSGIGEKYYSKDMILYKDSNGQWNFAYYVLGGVSVPNRVVQFTSNDLNDLYVKLANVLKGHDFNFSSAVAEIDQTVSMIGDTARNIGLGFEKLRHGDYKGAARAIGIKTNSKLAGAKTVSSAILQYKFGIAPLLSDVKSGAESVAKSALDLSNPRTEKIEATWFKPYEDNYRTYDHQESMLVKFKLPITTHIATPPPFTEMVDPRQVIWERTSMSWVVDYIIPVGSYLAALDLSPIIGDSIICDTRIFRSHTTRKSWTDDNVAVRSGGAFERRTTFTREPRPYAPELPSIVPFNEMLNLGRCVNLIAVAISRLK